MTERDPEDRVCWRNLFERRRWKEWTIILAILAAVDTGVGKIASFMEATKKIEDSFSAKSVLADIDEVDQQNNYYTRLVVTFTNPGDKADSINSVAFECDDGKARFFLPENNELIKRTGMPGTEFLTDTPVNIKPGEGKKVTFAIAQKSIADVLADCITLRPAWRDARKKRLFGSTLKMPHRQGSVSFATWK